MSNNSTTKKIINIQFKMFILIIIIRLSLNADIAWSKTLGGASDDRCMGIAIDPSSNLYIAGQTNSNPFDGNAGKGNFDAFVSKFDSLGVKQWTKTIGGTNLDIAQSIAVDSNSNSYIAGYSASNPFDGIASKGSNDAFIAKYDSTGAKQWSKMVGGTGNDRAYGVAVDSSFNSYITGYAASNPFDGIATIGGNDVFISKFDPSGTRLWTQILGGTGQDLGQNLTTDSNLNVYVTGYTNSVTFDGQATSGDYDVFVVKYDTSGVKQ